MACGANCPCQCVKPKRRRARKSAPPRRNPVLDLLSALLVQKHQEGINKPPVYKPEPPEKKSVATSTERAEPIETQTIETQTEKEKRIKIPKQEKGEEGFGAMRGEALEELRMKVQAEPKIKTIEDYFKPSTGGDGGGAERTARTSEDLKRGLEKTKEKRKKNLGVMGNLVGSLQEATDKSSESEKKVDFP